MSNAELFATRADYLKAYALTSEPFSSAPDGRFFYGGSALMQRLDLLTHLTQFGESVILVSGPQGSGKTTLLGRFVGQTGKHWRLCLINAEDFAGFRQRLGDALGVGDEGDAQRILEQWAAHSDVSQLLVIVIDDSQQLPADALEKLCALISSRLSDRVRLIMFGTPEAQTACKQALDRKNLPCTAQLLEIPRLSEEDTAAYLMYRLAVAGYSGESPFTPTEVRAICKAADGRPALINRLAHDALLEHQMRSRSKRLRPHKRPFPLALGAVSLLLLGVAIYLGWGYLQPTASIDQSAANRPERDQVQALPSPPEPEPVLAPAVVPPPVAVARPDQHLPIPEPEIQPEMQAPGITESSEITAVQTPVPPLPETRVDLASNPEPERPPQEPAPKPPTATPAAVAPTEAVPATTAPQPNDAPVSPAKPAATASQAAKPTVPTTVSTKSPGTEKSHRESWLLQQPEGNYSLQLLGMRNEQSIVDYIRQNKLDPAKTAYYRGTYRGGDWYVLLYGIFPNRQAALVARTELPGPVQKEKPWPRSLTSVHAAIREVQ